jgi:hypothetical protein
MRQLTACGRKLNISGTLLRVAKLDADKYHFLDDPEELLSALRLSPTRIDILSFLQRVGDESRTFPFPAEMDNLAVLPISTFDEWWKAQIRFEARNRAKQAAKKGLAIREVEFSEDLVRGIWEIYNETPIRQGRPFPHYGKSLQTVYNETATYLDWSTFVGLFEGSKLVGFAKLVSDERRVQANFMNILALLSYRDRAPTNAIVAEAVRSCASRGIKYLVYQNFVYCNKRSDSLSKFKEVNGFRRVDVPRYFVPLTQLGKIAVSLGFHKRLTDRLPVPLAEQLRKCRNEWYRLTTHASGSA